MAGNRPTATFAGTRLEALQALSRYTRVDTILAVPGSRVHDYCIANDVPFELSDQKDRAKGFHLLREQRTDLVFSAGFPFILPDWVLQSGALFINSHPALLPAYKGKNAIKEAYAAGEQYMGVSVHHMVAEVDSGALLWQERVWVEGCTLDEIYSLLFGVVEPFAISQALAQVLRPA